MPRQVVILHGWSDDSSSFKGLASFLKANGFRTHPIHLGDYISLRDDVRIDDVAKRMESVIRDAQSRTGSRKLASTFDMIVHSTGGLVARQWISSYYGSSRSRSGPSPCPVQNLVMLAPANFGSRLAHLGRSMLGRVAKGWRTGLETGEEMLEALELGSPYQWELAERDLFVPEGLTRASAPPLYGADQVRPYVIVGSYPYQAFAARLTNENGSDGTVRIAAANMNAKGMTVDFAHGTDALRQPRVTRWRRRGGASLQFPLAVLPDRDHGSIVHPKDPGASNDPNVQRQLGRLILQALTGTASNYVEIAREWRDVSMATRSLSGDAEKRKRLLGDVDADYYNEHFQIVMRAEDEFGTPIPDYFVRFVKKPRRRLRALSDLDRTSAYFHDEALEAVHTHRRSPEYRNFYIDRYDMMGAGGWYAQIRNPEERRLTFTVTAADPGERIAYFEHRPGARGVVLLHQQAEGERWLNRHSTHFIRLIVPRAATAEVFKLKRG
jgi:hypothetical protein